MKLCKTTLLSFILIALCCLPLAACAQHNSAPPPAVTQNEPNGIVFSWAPVANADGYLVKIDDATKIIGNPVRTTYDSLGNKRRECRYVVDSTQLSAGNHTVQFASYTSSSNGTQYGAWGQTFTVFVLNSQQPPIAVTAPQVEVYSLSCSFRWEPIIGATGYFVTIDGEIQDISNPLFVLEKATFCYYALDTSEMDDGYYCLQFAAYHTDQTGATTVSNWSDEYKVCVGDSQEEAVTAPVAIQDPAVDTLFVWRTMYYVSGFLAAIDNEIVEIFPSAWDDENSFYQVDAALGLGTHTIRFAAYTYDEDDIFELGDWTKVFTFTVG